jgi:hypothetical protein
MPTQTRARATAALMQAAVGVKKENDDAEGDHNMPNAPPEDPANADRRYHDAVPLLRENNQLILVWQKKLVAETYNTFTPYCTQALKRSIDHLPNNRLLKHATSCIRNAGLSAPT